MVIFSLSRCSLKFSSTIFRRKKTLREISRKQYCWSTMMWWARELFGERMGWKCSKSLLALTSEVRLRRRKKYFLCSSLFLSSFHIRAHIFLNITSAMVESNVYVRMDAHGWNEMLWLPIHHLIVNYYKAFLWTKDNGLLNFSSNSLHSLMLFSLPSPKDQALEREILK